MKYLMSFLLYSLRQWHPKEKAFPAGIYLLKVNNRNTRTLHHWRRSGIFIVNFEHISHLVLVFLLSTLNM